MLKTEAVDATETQAGGARAVAYVALTLAIVVVAVAGWAGVDRLADVAPGHDVPVELRLTHEQARLMLGLDRNRESDVDMTMNSITMPVEHPSSRALVALWAGPISRFLAITAGAFLAWLLVTRVASRGGPHRGTAWLVFVGAGIAALDWVLHAVLGHLASVDLRALYFDDAHEGNVPPLDLAPLGWILFLLALGFALRAGERLRRETEGLV